VKTEKPFQFGWFEWFCLWYPPGWLILFNRHWQHYYADPDGWNWFEYTLFLIPGGFYLALLIRWLRLGGKSPRSDDAIAPGIDYRQAFRDEILQPILKHYFRAELQQVENLPTNEAVIVAINHAGMCFPWDFIGLAVLLSQTKGWLAQPLAHPIFFEHPWLRWWLPVGWATAMGAVPAERESLEAAIAQKTVLLYAPESWRGLAKGWQHRYQLETFDPSFVRLSARYQVPILPVICLGNESLHPWAFNLKRVADWFKLPMFPISPLILAFILFPSMGVWVMRSRLRYFVQPLYRPWEHTEPEQLQKRAVAYQEAEQIRLQLQEKINQLRKRGWVKEEGGEIKVEG
jgi:1-acyl-sn-glycerol-3-phosphate acyltransferase